MESTRAASRKARVYVLRDFLLKTYHLGPNDVILDVAGGKGDLSWLLRNVDDLNSVVLDPRRTKDHISKSVRYLRSNPDEAKTRAVPGLPTYQPLATLLPQLTGKDTFQAPRNIRILVDQDLVDAVQAFISTQNLSDWLDYWERATEAAQAATPLGYAEARVEDSHQITEAKESLETILATKLIVALHPDQGLDACLDLAKELNVPCCVVPCCVFANEFPHRRLQDGRKVKRYPELIDYLKEKFPDLETGFLEFHFTETAKNIVLYTKTS